MDQTPDSLVVIGWQEAVDFPEWHLRNVRVKVDTGARTSALDVISYQLRQVAGQGLMAELRLALYRKRPERIKVLEVPVLRMVVVCNSSGMREQRPLIETTMRLGPVSKRVQLTVTNRFNMRFPVILGRKALAGDFLVDANRRRVLRKPRRKQS
jgi:hypothetical protein